MEEQKNKKHNPFSTRNISFERKKLSNFLISMKLKYVKLVYHYLISNAMYLILIPLLGVTLSHLSKFSVHDLIQLYENLKFNFVSMTLCSSLIVFLATLFFMSRTRGIYLVDFACYKPPIELSSTIQTFVERSIITKAFTDENILFQKKILERSGLGQKTYFPPSIRRFPPNPCMDEARKEAEEVMFGAIDEVLEKTGVKAKDIGILVVNCSLFNPTPSLSAMIVNRYNLGENVMSYNLGGMGCSAGVISIDLANQLLQVFNYILVFLM
jgi:3-ketoacyl-CoA synthase